jgi:hypothetical protein
MGTVYDAIELWSSNLYEQVRMLAQRRGWATRPYSYLLAPEPMRFISFTATTLHLPGGMGASFTPRSRPTGDAWVIDVRRTDGKVPSGAEGWALRGPRGALSDSELGWILEELSS